MKFIMYELTKETRVIENEECVVYGIRYDDEYYSNNISSDKAEVENLIRLANYGELAPYQLKDLVDDLING